MRKPGPSPCHAVSLLLLAATALPAQQQFAELCGRHLPAWRGNVGRLALADVDDDGDLDLVLPVRGGPNRLWQNDGSGVFTDVTATHMPPGADEARAVAVADIDGDGDLDLAFANLGGQGRNRLYRNVGAGVFQDTTQSHLPHQDFPSTAVQFVDVDGDGDQDLVFAQHGAIPARHRLFRNNGTGAFVDDSAASMPPAPAQPIDAPGLAAADVDGDGDQDLVVTGDATQLYANDGTGHFANVTATRLPASIDAKAAAFGDIDGDGDVDLVLARSGQNRLYRNLGTGTFLDATTTAMAVDTALEHALVLRDFDGDGDLDLATANVGPDRFYRNVGGVFVDTMAQRMPWHEDESRGLAAGDVDGDGDVDLVFGNQGSTWSRLVLNDGSARFTDTIALQVPWRSSGVDRALLADLDGDENVDLVVADDWRAWAGRNDGSGRFSRNLVFDLMGANQSVQGLALADVDGDADRDLLVTVTGSVATPSMPCRLYRNSGSGTFQDVSAAWMPTTPPSLSWPGAITTGDFDQDGDIDVVSVGDGIRLCLENTGTQFVDRTSQRLPPLSGAARTIAAGDLDADGDLDLVLGMWLQPARIWTNQGNGVFADTTSGSPLAATVGTAQVLLGDFDGDLDLDLLFAGDGQEQLFRNDGSGVFTDVTGTSLPAANDTTPSAAAADLDGDGDLDLVLGGYVDLFGPPTGNDRVLRNDGSGVFTDVTPAWAPPTIATTHTVAIADVDRDGDPDVLLGKPMTDTLWTNLQRQLDAPFVLRAGRPWTLEAHVRGGSPGSSDVVWPWLSSTRIAVPVPPFGVLGIDPIAALPPMVLALPAGSAAVTWAVPNAPSLAGLAVYAQAVQLSAASTLHLTNVVRDVLRR